MSVPPRPAEQLLTRLEWTVLRPLDGVLQGDYRTLFRGIGLDFADLREYQLYDDVRHIDWNVTARTQVTHVRVYNEDREITAWFLLDLSPSVDFGSGEATKRQVLTEFVAVMARILTRQGNKVGAILFDGVSGYLVPPRAGRRHLLYMLDKIMAHPRLLRAPQTDLGDFVRRALASITRRAVVFVVSDFISMPGWEKAMAALNQRHEGLAVRLVDPLETALPDLGLLPFEDSESGEQIFVDTSDASFRYRFELEAARREDAMVDAFARSGLDVLELSTDDDLLDAVMRFAGMRKSQAQIGPRGVMP
jgi:uncharacterized protein (DUF58 family)